MPVQGLLRELAGNLDIKQDDVAKVAKVFEDNEGFLKLANSPLTKTTPQSKFYAVKYHWFREQLEPNNIEILPISTEQQLGDIYTKGLGIKEFESKRKMIMGW